MKAFSMTKRRVKNKEQQKKIAKQRIQQLFFLAEHYALCGRLNLSDRYVFLARKISMRYLTPIPKKFKRLFCKHCYSYLLPSVTCRTRIHKGKIITYCTNCKKYMRMPIQERLMK